MSTTVVIAEDGFACGLCDAVGGASSFGEAADLADRHLRAEHALQWKEIAPNQRQLVAEGQTIRETRPKSIR